MGSNVVRMAFGAFIGAAAMYAGLMFLGMSGEAQAVLGLMCLFIGVQLGALLYDKRHMKEVI